MIQRLKTAVIKRLLPTHSNLIGLHSQLKLYTSKTAVIKIGVFT